MRRTATEDVYKRQENELTPEYIIPSPFDERVAPAVAEAVAKAARETNVNRLP